MMDVGAWFGEPWPSPDYRAPVCADDTKRVAVPVGVACAWCGETIGATDRGTFLHSVREDLTQDHAPIHRECSFRLVMGGIGHHEDHAIWCGEHRDPDGGRTARQSALEVWDMWSLYGDGGPPKP